MRTCLASLALAAAVVSGAAAQTDKPAPPDAPAQPAAPAPAPVQPAAPAPVRPGAQAAPGAVSRPAPAQPALPAPVAPTITPARPAMPAAPSIAPVYCGTVICFHFRVAALGKGTDVRANTAMDIINKYLGGSVGKVTTRPAGKNIQLLLNNEVVAVITPADAAAEKQKTVDLLAARWSRVLAAAFKATKAQP